MELPLQKENSSTQQQNYECVKQFKRKIREGPFYICTVCHRIMYRKAVQQLVGNKYPRQDIFTGLLSFDKTEYICSTCQKNEQESNAMPVSEK